MDTIQKEKIELIELFGQHFEAYHHFSPLASRILANLIVDSCKYGLTFDDLVERMNASKSSVSTNLNLLLKTGKITYYTLPGDRKKYFKPSPFADRLDNYKKMLEFEKDIIDRMLSYREKTMCNAEEKRNLENVKAYKEYVLDAEDLLMTAIDKFKEIERLNP